MQRSARPLAHLVLFGCLVAALRLLQSTDSGFVQYRARAPVAPKVAVLAATMEELEVKAGIESGDVGDQTYQPNTYMLDKDAQKAKANANDFGMLVFPLALWTVVVGGYFVYRTVIAPDAV